MIKMHYGPATEELLEALMPQLVEADIESGIAEVVIDGLKSLGYTISIEVEVHGDMARALESSGDPSNYVKVERPKRRT